MIRAQIAASNTAHPFVPRALCRMPRGSYSASTEFLGAQCTKIDKYVFGNDMQFIHCDALLESWRKHPCCIDGRGVAGSVVGRVDWQGDLDPRYQAARCNRVKSDRRCEGDVCDVIPSIKPGYQTTCTP